MSESEQRTIRPADILELIRTSAEQGFVHRNFRETTGDETFAQRTVAETAVVIDDAETPDIHPVTEALPHGIPEAEVEHRLAAARAAAKAEGIAEERARLMNEIEDKLTEMEEAKAAFERVVARLSEVQPDDSAMIVGALEEAIRRLASERAGIEIDETPQAFLQRIETLADRVSQGIRTVRVRLNPGDFAAIHPHIESSETIDEGMITADLSLGRGDVIVRADAIRLEDVIAPAQDTKRSASRASLKPASEN